MAITPLETDYLVIGGGAMGMAFTDVILSETDADLIIVDQNAKPGGHCATSTSCAAASCTSGGARIPLD